MPTFENSFALKNGLLVEPCMALLPVDDEKVGDDGGEEETDGQKGQKAVQHTRQTEAFPWKITSGSIRAWKCTFPHF